jgi:hypothetical protein
MVEFEAALSLERCVCLAAWREVHGVLPNVGFHLSEHTQISSVHHSSSYRWMEQKSDEIEQQKTVDDG